LRGWAVADRVITATLWPTPDRAIDVGAASSRPPQHNLTVRPTPSAAGSSVSTFPTSRWVYVWRISVRRGG